MLESPLRGFGFRPFSNRLKQGDIHGDSRDRLYGKSEPIRALRLRGGLSTPEEKLRGNGHNVGAKSWTAAVPENDFWPTSQLAKIPFSGPIAPRNAFLGRKI